MVVEEDPVEVFVVEVELAEAIKDQEQLLSQGQDIRYFFNTPKKNNGSLELLSRKLDFFRGGSRKISSVNLPHTCRYLNCS